MANPVSVKIEVPITKILKRCPNCGATRFQGPEQRGEISNGQFVKLEELWLCVGCNRVLSLPEMNDLEVPIL